MLVYEFLSKGSLHDVLHGSRRDPLNLKCRLDTAAESAEGLTYLHSKTTNVILHGDVKPTNILLDEDWTPKISDFGISRLIVKDKQHTDFVTGDRSYMDPVYLRDRLLTDRSDAYSFRVVILELISRKKADNNSLVREFLDAHKGKKEATKLFDEEIAKPEVSDLLNSLYEIAVRCLNLDVDERPSMTEVAESILMLKRSWSNTLTKTSSAN
jgi:serine/threonine protein kinase